MEGAVGSLNQNLPDEQVAFSNDTSSDGPISEQDAEQVATNPAMDGNRTAPDPENKITDDETPQNYDPNGKADNPFMNMNTEDPEDAGAGYEDEERDVLGGGADGDFASEIEDESF